MLNNKLNNKVITLLGALCVPALLSVPAVSGGLPEPVTIAKPLKKDDASSRRKLMAILSDISAFSAGFDQVIMDETGNTLQQLSGKITVSKPRLVNWHTLSPDETQIVSDGDTLWFFDPFIEQVTAYTLDTSVNNTPILLLSSNDEQLWQQYNILETQENEFEILSLDEHSQVKSLSISFTPMHDSNAWHINRFVILDASGQKGEIKLTDFSLTPLINESTFTFTVPDGVHLDDQR